MCTGLSTLVGSGLIFLTSVVYGLMVLGPKASRDDMAATAQGSTAYPKSESTHSGLVGNIRGQDVEAAKGVY